MTSSVPTTLRLNEYHTGERMSISFLNFFYFKNGGGGGSIEAFEGIEGSGRRGDSSTRRPRLEANGVHRER